VSAGPPDPLTLVAQTLRALADALDRAGGPGEQPQRLLAYFQVAERLGIDIYTARRRGAARPRDRGRTADRRGPASRSGPHR